jgi:hypothetical protein
VLLLVALAVSQAAPPLPPVRLQASATVRIERPVSASRTDWDRLPASQRREVIARDEQGRPVLLRIVENE